MRIHDSYLHVESDVSLMARRLIVLTIDAIIALVNENKYLFKQSPSNLRPRATHKMPNPIRQLKDIFCFNSIFKFQNRLVGKRARMKSTKEDTAEFN